MNKYQQKHYEKHKEYYIKRARQWRDNHPEKTAQIMRSVHYRLKYGMTIKDYDFLYAMQDGKCACCGREDNYNRNHFDIDHDHCTNEVRGLLCTACNRMVGIAERCCDLPTYGLSEEKKKMAEKYLTGKVLLDIM